MRKCLGLMSMLAGLVLVASACGDDGGGGGDVAPADDPLVMAIVDEIVSNSDGLTADREEAECLAGSVVSGIGKDRLTELGVTESNVPGLDEIDWTDDEARTVVDRMFGCTDPTDSFIESLDFGELDDSQRECAAGVFNEDVLKDFFVTFLTGGEPGGELFTLMGQLTTDCGIDVLGS